MSAAAQDSLRLTVDVPREVRAGSPVAIVLRVENRGDRAIDLSLRGRTIAFDVLVAQGDGAVVWRRLEGEIIPAIVQLKTLTPGELLELRARWDQRTNRGQPVVPGVYSVRGVLLTDAAPLETPPAELRVRPR